MSSLAITFGKNIQALRKARNLTVTALAEILDVSIRHVYRWEAYESLPSSLLLARISKTFRVSIDSLLFYRIKPKQVLDGSPTIKPKHRIPRQ